MSVLHNMNACCEHAANKCLQHTTQNLHHLVKHPELASTLQQTACCAWHLSKGCKAHSGDMLILEVSITSTD